MNKRFSHAALRAMVLIVIVVAVTMAGACSVAESFLRQPLPPSETLMLEALLLEGGGMMPGTQVVRLGWDPPEEDLSVDLVVIEQSITAAGPWEEIAAELAATGHHEETSIFRPGNFYYFRAFMTRDREETDPAEPVVVWIPDVGAYDRTAPGVVAPPNRTPTPVPGSGVAPTPLPTITGDPSVPFLVVPPTHSPTPTPTP